MQVINPHYKYYLQQPIVTAFTVDGFNYYYKNLGFL